MITAGTGARRYTSASAPDRTRSTTGSRSGGGGSPSPVNGTSARTISRMRAVPAPTRRRPAQVERLAGDDEADRAHAVAQRDHLGQPARTQRGHRHPVLDALREARAGELVRHRRRQQPGLGGDADRRRAELRQPVVGQVAARLEPGRKRRERLGQLLHRALGRAGEHGRKADAQVVHRRGQRHDVEVGHRHDPVLGEDHERVLLRGVELDRELAARPGRARRGPRRGRAPGSGR